jgi:hypothetical protein
MKTFILAIVIALCTNSVFAATEVGRNSEEFGLNHASLDNFPKYQMGTALSKNRVSVEKCVYDFAVLGGAIGAVNLRSAQGAALCQIPKNAIITNVIIDVITAGTTSASGTMALGAASTADLKAALAAASYTGLVAGIPVGTAATAIKLAADATITGTIATGALTAGKWNVDIQYIMSQ